MASSPEFEIQRLHTELAALREEILVRSLTNLDKQAFKRAEENSPEALEVAKDLYRLVRQAEIAGRRADTNYSTISVLETEIARLKQTPPATPSGAPSQTVGHLFAKVYTPDGFQISLNLPIATTAEASRHMDDIRAAGLLAFMPETLTSEKAETIVAVFRREHWDENKKIAVPVIDMFPEWFGEYGTFRFVGAYLNTPEDIAEFERQSGLKLADMPIHDGDGSIKRLQSRPLKNERPCKPFIAIKEPTKGTTEKDGKSFQNYRFSRYGGQPAAAAPTPPVAPVTPKPVVPTSMIPAHVQAALTSAINANPFDDPQIKKGIEDVINEFGLTEENGGIAYLLENLVVGRKLNKFSDAHPHLDLTQFRNRLIQLCTSRGRPTPSNPFDAPAVQAAIRAAVKVAGLGGAGIPFMLANIIPGHPLIKISDAHPHISPDEFMKRIHGIGAQYQARFDHDTHADDDGQQPAPDDDDDPAPSSKPAQPPRQPVTSKQASADPSTDDVRNALNNRPGSSTRQLHPLHGEFVEIERIEAVRGRGGVGWEQGKWTAHGTASTPSGIPVAFTLTVWPEDARKLTEAGHTINWPSSANDYAPFVTHPNPLVIAEFRKSSGLCIRSAEPVKSAGKKSA